MEKDRFEKERNELKIGNETISKKLEKIENEVKVIN